MKNDFEQAPFGLADFADNAEARCLCVLMVDTSGSMKGERIAQLNSGLETFAAALREDPLAAKRVGLAVVTCGGEHAQVVSEFGSAQDFYPQPLKASGGTPLGGAINLGLDLIAARKTQCRENGIAMYRPVILAVTDGAPTNSWERAARRIQQGEESKSFSFFAVGVDGADMNMLAQISVNEPVMLRGLAFADMFRWLSASLSAVSRSSVGQPVALSNPAGPAGWATIV